MIFQLFGASILHRFFIDFLHDFGERFLGKVSIIAKDTPGFIGNRIGMFGMSNILNMVQELGLTVEEIDKLTGPIIGNPKSATFRTSDVVGLDTTVNVAKGIFENCPDDEFRDIFIMPDYIGKMVENNWLGSKTGSGFYKRIKNSGGKSSILSLDLETLEYRPTKKVVFETIGLVKKIENI